MSLDPESSEQSAPAVATLVDVARAARVSVSTASRAINGRPYVSAPIRAQVLEAARRLHFQPSSLARGFRAQRTMTIGMVVPDISSPFYAAALRGAQNVLRAHGYTVLVCETEERADRENEALLLLAGQRVAGLILAPVGGGQAGLRRLLDQRPIALVAIDNRLQGYEADTVVLDNRRGAAALAGHLASHGHRRIAHLTGILNESSALDRLAGYRDALDQAGLPFRPELVLEGDWTEQSGCSQTIKLLDLAEPPTALLAASSQMMVGTLLALKARGIVVPESMALACFDDTPWAPVTEPALTTLSRCDYALGTAAAELIVAQLSTEPGRPRCERILPLELVRRRSCGCLAPVSQETSRR
ncbi:MAG: LacI family DNA-binding transcriptional regulator [Chloroflexota bacterium]